ncbi:DUF481 domain-containing protein [Pseudomonas sp. LA21]|uniref:DUF481 domain-containing protein n=1 Tax=unclassified Pseudomonas TaxID=196821 RepID=UPI001FB60D7A|nr:DUF481 domain-containing protein [Pseudomonas sp. LA21]MCJ1885001.1 DUF481 domain-containing protein [Pseudomonas sp. LA21]
MLSRNLLFVALATCSISAVADTVWLKNGDRLTGTIKLYDGGKLLLNTDYGGEITLKGDQIATLETEQNLLVKYDEETGEHSKGLKASEPGKVTLVNGSPRTVDVASIEQMMPPKPILEDWVWTGNVDFSLDHKQAENDVEDYDIDFKTNARHGRWRHNLQGEYNREKKDDSVSTNNYSAEYALDRFLDEHWFWQGQAQYKRDWVEDLQKKRTVGTGPGYQFWDNELGAFSLAALINRNDYEFTDNEKDHFYSSSLKWDYNRFLLAKKFELFTNGEVSKPLESNVEYELDSEAGVRYKLTSWASLSMKAEWDKLSGHDGDVNERRYTLGLGVGW